MPLTREAHNAYCRERYHENLAWLRELKVERGCADCGYDSHHAGLEFDHIRPRKRGTVASVARMGRALLEEEVERCEVVCGTCHGIRTFERRQQ